jgi:hypothetical protein
MPPAKKHIREADLTCKLAAPTLEGFTDLAGKVHDGELIVGIFLGHEEHFPFW